MGSLDISAFYFCLTFGGLGTVGILTGFFLRWQAARVHGELEEPAATEGLHYDIQHY